MPGEPVEAPLIDLDHLAAQTLGDDDLQIELLGLFARQAKGILAGLQASALLDGQSAGPLSAADRLHTLCGSARAVGSWGVAEEAEDLERVLRRSAIEAVPEGRDKLATLARSVEQVCAAIEKRQSGRVA